jgi:uncharacterized protein
MSDGRQNHHEIDYIEFGVTDMAEAQRFYAAAFDWEFTDYGPEYAGIRKRSGGEAGGLRVQPEVATGGPLVILYSNDLERTLARVRDAGGQVTQDIFAFSRRPAVPVQGPERQRTRRLVGPMIA